MDTTPNRAYPFPEGGDPIGDINLAVQQLAEAADTDMQNLRDDLDAAPDVRSGVGTLTHPGGTVTYVSGRVEFGHTFATVPVVIPVPDQNGKEAIATAVDTTGFTARITTLAQVFGYTVAWMAQG
jgi:hypothetical protein